MVGKTLGTVSGIDSFVHSSLPAVIQSLSLGSSFVLISSSFPYPPVFSTPFPFETEPVVLYASESASGRKIFISNP